MLLIAQRERNEQLLRQVELQSENEQLRTMLSARRVPGSSVRGTPCKSMIRSHGVMSFAQKLASSGSRGEWKADDSDDNVYDWVCEISKLSDVGTAGWVLRYSSRFLASLSESEKAMVMGTEPVTFRADADANGSDADDGSYDGDAPQPPGGDRPTLWQEGVNKGPLIQARRRGGHEVRRARLGGLVRPREG